MILLPNSDIDWDNKDASVICRMLGFNPGPGSSSVALTYSSFGFIDYPNFNMTDVQCTGSEQSIYDCISYRPYYWDDGNSAAGVMCDFTPPPNTTIELVGGNNTKEGNVLLNGSPIW